MNKYNEKVHFIFNKFWLPSVSNYKTNYNQLFIELYLSSLNMVRY